MPRTSPLLPPPANQTELIRKRGPWRGLDDVELATLEHVDWYNHRRLHSHCSEPPMNCMTIPHDTNPRPHQQ